MGDTIKGLVNKKWTSSDKFRDNYDRIFHPDRAETCEECNHLCDDCKCKQGDELETKEGSNDESE